MTDLSKSFDKFISAVFIKHAGVTLERCYGGYKLNGKFYPTLESVDIELEERRNIIQKSIINKN